MVSGIHFQSDWANKSCEESMKIMCRFISISILLLLTEKALALNDVQKIMIQSKFLIGGMECLQDHPLTAQEIMALKSKMMPESKDAKCFAACLFKKLGIMDDMGKLSRMRAVESAKEVFKDDDHVKEVGKFIEKCSSVNMQKVSDGDMGCERAKMAFSCLAENVPKIDFNLNL